MNKALQTLRTKCRTRRNQREGEFFSKNQPTLVEKYPSLLVDPSCDTPCVTPEILKHFAPFYGTVYCGVVGYYVHRPILQQTSLYRQDGGEPHTPNQLPPSSHNLLEQCYRWVNNPYSSQAQTYLQQSNNFLDLEDFNKILTSTPFTSFSQQLHVVLQKYCFGVLSHAQPKEETSHSSDSNLQTLQDHLNLSNTLVLHQYHHVPLHQCTVTRRDGTQESLSLEELHCLHYATQLTRREHLTPKKLQLQKALTSGYENVIDFSYGLDASLNPLIATSRTDTYKEWANNYLGRHLTRDYVFTVEDKEVVMPHLEKDLPPTHSLTLTNHAQLLYLTTEYYKHYTQLAYPCESNLPEEALLQMIPLQTQKNVKDFLQQVNWDKEHVTHIFQKRDNLKQFDTTIQDFTLSIFKLLKDTKPRKDSSHVTTNEQ